MRTTELFRSCANEHVAAAALACIGGTLQRRVIAAARRAGLSRGALVARLVADYDRMAGPKRRQSLEQGMVRHPMPILAGLRHVVHVALEGEWEIQPSRSRVAGKTLDHDRIRWPQDCSAPERNAEHLKSLCV
ncbi:hypothetical protein [uncultured Rhodoblastus sp.]|uniref:hypothetical protein n=1 Tax=uncultured Rhodoblastus sp. TaxID=543037 RepID=UPI0025D8B4A3|nr:hypothetical protein [uncultured Rhodoblastus sp.]